MSKAQHNPTGHPLSGRPKKGRVTYRPRVGKSRPRYQVPEDVASKLEDDAVNATDRRRSVAADAARAEKERRAAKKTPAKKKRAKRASSGSRKAPKAPKAAKPRARKKAPPRAVAKVAKALDVPKTTAKAIVSCAQEKVAKTRKPRKKKAAAESAQVDLFAKNPTLKRGPCSVSDLQVCTFIGHITELAYDTSDGYRQRMKKPSKPVPLYWAPAAKAAIFVNGKTRRSRATEGVRDGKARAVYRSWTGREADDAYTITIPKGAQAKWRKLGKGFTITYRSERSSVPAEHDLGRTVGVYTFGTLWVVTGSGLRIGKHGLEG